MSARQASYPRFWFKLSVPAGNLLQAGGIAIGALLLTLTAALRDRGPLASALMVAGFVSIYLCSHALAHWLAGRLLGLQFRYVGVRGTDHPESYPPGLRQLMPVLPTFTVVSTRESRSTVSAFARALYFAAGETSRTLCSTAAALTSVVLDVPGARVLLAVAVLGNLVATINTTANPKGDYAEALAALRSSSSTSNATTQSV